MCINCPDSPVPPSDTEMLTSRCIYPIRQDATAEVEVGEDDE